MGVVKEIKSHSLRYINVANFGEEDAKDLKKRFRFHDLDLEDCMSMQERPKIDEYDNYLFIVLQIPYFDHKHETVELGEVDVFIGQNYLVLVQENNVSWVSHLDKQLESVKGRKDLMANGAGYLLYRIVEGLFESNYKIIDRLQRDIRILEKDIFANQENQDRIEDILQLKKSITSFRRAIGPQRSVISQLEHKNKKFIKEDLEVYFDDVVDIIEKIWQMLETMKETVETLENANENMMSHRMNKTMKVLTVVNVALLPMNFITNLYSMNISLPEQKNPYAFPILAIFVFFMVLLVMAIFRWRRWI